MAEYVTEYEMQLYIIFILIFTAVFPAFADVTANGISDRDDRTVYLYTGDASVTDPFQLDAARFKPMPDRFSLGYTREPHWFKISFKSETDTPLKRFVSLEDGFMFDRVDFYQIRDGKLIKVTNDGVYVPAKVKEEYYHGAVSLLTAEGKGVTDIYVRAETKTPCLINLRIVDETAFNHYNKLRMFFLSLLTGSMLAIAFYNLFIFFSLRSKEYVYYFIYVISALIFMQAQTGFVVDMYGMYGDTRTNLFISVYLMSVFLLLFTQQVLETKKHLPLLHKIFNAVIVIDVLGILAALVLGMKETLFLQTPFVMLTSVVMAVLSVAAIIKRIHSAWYYFIAVGISIVTIFISSMMLMGRIEYTIFTRNAYFFGCVAEAVLLSWLLSYRINSLRSQTIAAQQELIDMKDRANKQLESLVYERTKELEVKNAELENLAVMDELTGLYNRRFLLATYDKKLKTCADEGKYLVFILLDVDFFKKYNDLYGHHKGDDALKKVSGILIHSFRRTSDHVFRIGGEEFVVLCTADTQEEAAELGETLRRNIEAADIEHKEGVDGKLTCSVGVYAVNDAEVNFSTAYRIADQELYESKNGGRNMVSVFKG